MDRTHPDYKGLRGNAPSASPFPQGAPPGQPYGQGHSYAQQQAAAPNPLGPPHPAPFHANNQTDQNFSFSQLNPQQQQFLLQQLQQQQRQQLSPQTQQTQPTQQPFIQSFPQTTGPPQPQFSPQAQAQAQAQAQPSSWAAQTAYSAFPPSPFTPAESVSFGDSSALSAVQANVYGFPRSPAPPATAAAVSPPQTPSYNTFLPTSVARAVSGAPSAVSRQTSDVAMPQQQPVLLPQPSVAPSSGSALEYHEDRLVSLFEVERRLAPLGELIYSLQHEPLTRAFNIAITEIKSLVEARAVSPAMSGAGAALPFAVDGLTVHAAAMFDLRSPEAIIAVVPAHTYQDALGNAISGALLDSITVKKGKRSSHPSSARVDGVIFDLSNKRGAQKVSQIALEFEPKGSVCRVARNLFAYHEQSRRVLQLHVSDTDGASVLPVEQLKSFNSMTPSVIVGDVGLYEFRVLYRQPNGTFLLLPKAVFFSKLRPEPKAKRSRTTAAGRSSESLHPDPDYDRTSPPLFMPFPPAAPLPRPVPGVDVPPNASEFSFNEPGPFRALSIMEPVPEESRAAAHKGLYPSPPSGDADGFVKVDRHSDKTALPTVTVVEAPSSSTPDDFVRVSPAGPSSKPGVSSASAAAPARSSGPRQWTLSDYVRDATSLCLWADDAFRHIEVELHLGPVSSPSDSVALELQGETGRVLVLQPVYQSPTVLLFELTPAMQQRYWPKSFEAAPATVQAVLIVNGHQHAWSIRFVVEESDEEESEEELAAPAQSQPGQPAPGAQQPQSAYTRLPSVPQSVPAPVPNPYTRQTSFPTTAGPVVKPVDLAAIAKAAFVAEEVAEPKETSDEPLNTSDDPSQRTPSAVFGQAALLPPSSSTPKPAQSAPSTRPIARAANPALDQAIQKGRVTGLIDDLGLAFYDRHRAESTEQFIGSLLLEFPPKECVPSYRSLLVAMMKPFLDEFQSGKVQEIAFLTFLLLFGPFDKCFDKFSCLVVPPSGGRPPGRRSWFWGRETNRGVAASNIQSAERGTFLIRLSSNGVSFAVTYIDEDGSLKHSRILNSVPGYHFEDQADLFSSLHELVRSFPHIFKCAFRDPNECVTFKPLNGKPIEVPVKKLQKYPNTLLGSMFDPSNDEVEGREYQQDEFTVPKGSGAVPVVASSAVFAAILEFYNSGAVKRAGLDPKELDEALFLFRIPANEGQ